MSWLGTKFRAFKDAYEKFDSALYPILGLPSYEKYLEHFKKTHPGEKPLSKKEFFAKAEKDKYGPGRAKC